MDVCVPPGCHRFIFLCVLTVRRKLKGKRRQCKECKTNVWDSNLNEPLDTSFSFRYFIFHKNASIVSVPWLFSVQFFFHSVRDWTEPLSLRSPVWNIMCGFLRSSSFLSALVCVEQSVVTCLHVWELCNRKHKIKRKVPPSPDLSIFSQWLNPLPAFWISHGPCFLFQKMHLI